MSAAAEVTRVTSLIRSLITAPSEAMCRTAGAYTPFEGVSTPSVNFRELRRRISVPGPIQLFALSLVVCACFMVFGLASAGFALDTSIWTLAALGAVAFVAERQSVRVGKHTEASVSSLPILFAALVYGPLAAMAVGALALLGEFRRPYTRWTIWTTSRALVGGAAGTVSSLVADGEATFAALLAAAALAGITEGALDSFLVASTAALRKNASFQATARMMARLLTATLPLQTPVVAVLAYAYIHVSVWTVFLFLLPALASQRFLLLYQEQRQLAEDVLAANKKLERANLSFAAALVSALDARDRYTAGHSAAVAIYARDIATNLRLGEREQRLVHLAGLLHDIGKVGIPPGVLEKEGPLTPHERREMEEHVIIGERILGNVEAYAEIAMIVRHHHERFDGSGYPDGLAGSSIPILSRIIAVADAYNAMTSGRPYRQALSVDIARGRLDQASGTQFDPLIVATFQELLTSASDSYAIGVRADFGVEAQRHSVMITDAIAA
jgi:putative nucleotidyltransferase with HDIG domain